VGSHAIKVVEMDLRGPRPRLLRRAMAPLPPESIVDSEIMDRQLVVETIQNLFERAGIRNRRVRSALAGRGVIVKRIRMERVPETEAAEAVRAEAEHHVPYDIEDVSLDFQILDPQATPREMEVLLVAAKRERINDHASLLREAGLQPVAVDLQAFAVQNALEFNHDVGLEEVVALVNIGSELTNVSIVRGGIPLHTQDISTGGQDFLRAVQKAFQCTREEALAALQGNGPSGVELGPLVDEFCAELAATLEKSLLYLKTTESGIEGLDRVFLSGGGALIPGLADGLAQHQEARVEVLDPLRRLQVEEEEPLQEAEALPKGPQLAVGVGLVLRKGKAA
jgi:type IV pilus assembly protein PilM